MDERTKPPTPGEALDALRNHLPIVTDILITNVQDDTRGQTATITFNEDAHPLHVLMVDELGDRQPSKRFVILMIEVDDQDQIIDQVRRAKVRKLMNKQGRATKHFFALLRDVDFQRWLYSVHNVTALAGADTVQERAEICRDWAEEHVGHEDLDVDQAAFERFDHEMRIPFYEWRAKRRAAVERRAHEELEKTPVHGDGPDDRDRAPPRARREHPGGAQDHEDGLEADERVAPDSAMSRAPHRGHGSRGDGRRRLGTTGG